MPSPATTDLPRPKGWDELENIMADLIAREWNDPNVVRNGRSGQRQAGVDIYGQPKHLGRGPYAGVQCKCMDVITLKEVQDEVKKAQNFKPPLADYTVATTAPRDSSLQEKVRTGKWPFPVRVWFWEDISLRLSGHQELMEKHFAGFMKLRTTEDNVLNLLQSTPPNDFSWDDGRGEFTCKRDVELQLVYDRSTYRDFKEAWLNAFPDSTGNREELVIRYGASTIRVLSIIYVDGGRYCVPLPRHADLTISPLQYHVGRIINRLNPLDQALSLAGITVRQTE